MAGIPRSRVSDTYKDVIYKSLTEISVDGSEYIYQSGSEFPMPTLQRNRQCFDVVGNWEGDNPFLSVNASHSPCPYESVLVREWIQWEQGAGDPREVVYKERTTVTGSVPLTLPPYNLVESDIAFVTRAYADTNPSAADFDAPVFIAELRDVPSLLRNAAQKLSKAGASEYLKYEYGWKPLISDVRKLVGVMSKLEKRLQTLRRLRDKHVIKRTYAPPDSIEAAIITDFVSDIPAPNAYWVAPRIEARIETQRWAKTTWIADPVEGLPPTDAELMRTAQRAAFGGTIDGSTLWELMPWSWLIDWNVNMSDFLQSQRNVVGASPGPSCLMKQTRFQVSASPVWNNASVPDLHSYSVFGYPGSYMGTAKERILGIEPEAVTTGEITLIGDDFRKQSILGSLGLQRLRSLPF